MNYFYFDISQLRLFSFSYWPMDNGFVFNRFSLCVPMKLIIINIEWIAKAYEERMKNRNEISPLISKPNFPSDY